MQIGESHRHTLKPKLLYIKFSIKHKSMYTKSSTKHRITYSPYMNMLMPSFRPLRHNYKLRHQLQL